jgi:hypothetical protein
LEAPLFDALTNRAVGTVKMKRKGNIIFDVFLSVIACISTESWFLSLMLISSALHHLFFFLKKHSINIDIYTRISAHLYKYICTHPTSMSISERLSRFNLEIYKVDHQKRLIVDGDVVSF